MSEQLITPQELKKWQEIMMSRNKDKAIYHIFRFEHIMPVVGEPENIAAQLYAHYSYN